MEDNQDLHKENWWSLTMISGDMMLWPLVIAKRTRLKIVDYASKHKLVLHPDHYLDHS